jgi:hypothetical protein
MDGTWCAKITRLDRPAIRIAPILGDWCGIDAIDGLRPLDPDSWLFIEEARHRETSTR